MRIIPVPSTLLRCSYHMLDVTLLDINTTPRIKLPYHLWDKIKTDRKICLDINLSSW